MSIKPTAAFQGKATTADQFRYRITEEAMGTVVIFGATGDLASRKLIPAIYNLWNAGFLPKRIAVVGVARRPKTDAQFREEMCEALKKFSRTNHGLGDSCDPFVSNVYYYQLELGDAEGYKGLRTRLDELDTQLGAPGNRLFYLAVAPEYFAPIVENLGGAGLVRAVGEDRFTRVVVEKPFGHDLESARLLNAQISAVLAEDQVYRIDHYLGKETVQNIFAFRFGNAIFEPLFNQKYVDHVQITMAETVGMEGRRGAFYDKTGALRDVVQNHLLQLLCLVAMEPPALLGAKHTRDEKVKVLSSVSIPDKDPLPAWCVRGQYAESPGQPGYLSEEGVAHDSVTETYLALRLHVDNWRWAGVPFLLRAGKRLKSRVTEIAIQFKQPPMHFFREIGIPVPMANMLAFPARRGHLAALQCETARYGDGHAAREHGFRLRHHVPRGFARGLRAAIAGRATRRHDPLHARRRNRLCMANCHRYRDDVGWCDSAGIVPARNMGPIGGQSPLCA
ncbi:MAG: glucose-6-phosphate dehydrogenase [Candidatus Hydrogenedentales bacterium]|jgi:glucose-6-phosphate 1-dehydrogenase